MAGYSGTPLAKKLGIKDGATILTINAPKDYAALLAPLPAGATITAKQPKARRRHRAPLRHHARRARQAASAARKAMKTGGAIWVSWYKKSARIATDVTEDLIRARALKTDLVDVKVCAVTGIWSGLKLVVRKALR